MDEKISVIVPVYNVEAYVGPCLDSLLNQTYSNLEILVVDDGSTDCSGIICDEYAEKDARIHVVHQANGGAASAKNTALRLATGELLAFADSDDIVETDAYTYMVEQLHIYNADVVQCGFYNFYSDHRELHEVSDQPHIFDTEEYLKKYTEDWTCGLLWDKLYRKKLFDGIFFETGHKIDDEFFTYRGVMNAKKIAYLPKPVYNYRMRKSSVMSSESSKKQIVLDRLAFASTRRTDVLAVFPSLKDCYDDHYANFLLLLLCDPNATEKSAQLIKKHIKLFLSEKPAPAISLRMKIQLYRALSHKSKQIEVSSFSDSKTKFTSYFE